jgi:hypothetical protein
VTYPVALKGGKNMPEEVIPPGKIKCFITGKLRKE